MAEPKRILLIEDSPTQSLEIKLQLEEKGFSVQIARTGDVGLALALTRSFDLILLDYQLPGLDGLDIIAGLTSEKVETPVIVITGLPDATIANVMRNAGVADYIIKDETFAVTLPQAVVRVLEQNK